MRAHYVFSISYGACPNTCKFKSLGKVQIAQNQNTMRREDTACIGASNGIKDIDGAHTHWVTWARRKHR